MKCVFSLSDSEIKKHKQGIKVACEGIEKAKKEAIKQVKKINRIHKIDAHICLDNDSIKAIKYGATEFFTPKFLVGCLDKIELSITVAKIGKRKSWANGMTVKRWKKNE